MVAHGVRLVAVQPQLCSSDPMWRMRLHKISYLIGLSCVICASLGDSEKSRNKLV
jgi:hypothetical protein